MMVTVLMIVRMILMMMLTKITITTTIMFLSILIPDTEMEVLPFYANIAQESSGLSVGKDKTFFDEELEIQSTVTGSGF